LLKNLKKSSNEMNGKALKDKILKKTQGMTHQDTSLFRHDSDEQEKHSVERLSHKKILSYASTVWQEQPIAESIATEASQIIKNVYKRKRIFFSGKSEKRILAGIFYLLGTGKAKKTQLEIGRNLNTSDVTIRASYRDWLENFPDLFTVETPISNHVLDSCFISHG
jgi:transcription initiation factor TFIIIB Brf1 subunit/transcription initiation factor TFIIB